MGALANYPIALAPAMGHNFFFVFTVCQVMGYPWQQALAANRQSVRANLMAGDLDAAAGRHEAAIADWRLGGKRHGELLLGRPLSANKYEDGRNYS